jgi:Ca-activated chloride channel family protein
VSFAHPAYLFIGAIGLALVAWPYRILQRRRDVQALAYSSVAFALDALEPPRWPAIALTTAFLLGTATVFVALANPRLETYLPSKDGTVMICLDTSGSMRAMDIEPTRWLAMKAAAKSFIDALPDGTHVGLLTFSSGANLIASPITDIDAVRDALDRIPEPDGATAIGDALTVAAQEMPKSGRRIIVLLTDGVNNRGTDPIAASQAIGAKGITIETVGIGTADSGEIIPGTNEEAGLDSDALQTIASNGHGEYVEASSAGQLRDVFRSIALNTVWKKRRFDASFPVAFAGGLVLVLAFLGGLFTGRIP